MWLSAQRKDSACRLALEVSTWAKEITTEALSGPHAAFMAVSNGDSRNRLARSMPGRIVGVSK